MVEERTGNCVICRTRDALPELEPCCGPCRSRLRNQVREIPELCAELASLGYVERDGRSIPPKVKYPPGHDREGEWVAHFEPLANVLPAGPVNGESRQPRVGGSRDAPMPIRADVVDLLGAADDRTVHDARRVPLLRTWFDPDLPDKDGFHFGWHREQVLDEAGNPVMVSAGDQVGDVAAATVLDGWCRDFAECRRETPPQPVVTVQCRYLADRLEWCFAEHPAVDEFATELGDLWHVLRRAAGRTVPRPEICWGIECRREDCSYVNTLVRVPGSEYIECSECGLLLTEDEYQAWVRMLAAAERKSA